MSQGSCGPYAENLRHVLRAVEGYYVSGYGDGGDAPDEVLEIAPGAVASARACARGAPGSRVRCEQVVHLVEGFESPFGLELLATVHWIVTRDHPVGEEDLVERVYAWAERKRQFSAQQIRLARRVLAERGWMASAAA